MGRLTGFSLGGNFNYINGKTPGQLSSISPTVITMTQESSGLYYLEGETTQETRSGKNILNIRQLNNRIASNYDTLEISDDDWIRYINTSGVNRSVIFDYIKVEPSTSYYVYVSRKEVTGTPFNILNEYDENYNRIGSTSYPNSSQLITTSSEAKYITLGITSNNMSSVCDYKTRLMIVKSSVSDNNYESYGVMPSPDFPSCLVNTYTEGLYKTTIGGTDYYVALNESLRSAGSVADRLYINTTNNSAYVVRNVGATTLTGSEEWTRFATTKQSYNLFINATNIVGLNDGTQTIVISNRFKGLTPTVILSNDDNSGISSRRNTNRGITISIDKVLAEKTTDFMNWLSNNNTKVYYALATPITENINIQ